MINAKIQCARILPRASGEKNWMDLTMAAARYLNSYTMLNTSVAALQTE
jgi:hypothetical protein